MLQVLPVPCFLYFYTIGDRYRDYVPHSWCFAYFCLTDYLPTIFHTASVWLTVALAAHRYVFVCHPGPAKRLCTMSNILRLIGIIYFTAVVSQLWRFFEYQYLQVDVPSKEASMTSDGVELNGEDGEEDEATHWVVNMTLSSPADNAACFYVLSPGVSRHESALFNTYYGFRVVCVHIVPCTSLVVLNSALMGAIRAAQRRRNQLLQRGPDPDGDTHLLYSLPSLLNKMNTVINRLPAINEILLVIIFPIFSIMRQFTSLLFFVVKRASVAAPIFCDLTTTRRRHCQWAKTGQENKDGQARIDVDAAVSPKAAPRR